MRKKILFIGGTQFLGRRLVEDALSQNHEVSILQRGITNSHLFPKVKKYIGDRRQIEQLIPHDAHFDVVIDTCGYHPEVVKTSCSFFRDKTSHYVFISTISVYADFSQKGLTENSKIYEFEQPISDCSINLKNYGPLKAACEKMVQSFFPKEKLLIVRPCIVAGPYDYTNRFEYWVQSMLTEPRLDTPDEPDAHIQFIDVRALSRFILDSLNAKRTGIYNLVGPKNKIRFLEFIDLVKQTLNSHTEIRRVDPQSHNFPLYFGYPLTAGAFHIDGSKAYNDGLIDISVVDTITSVSNYIKIKNSDSVEFKNHT